MLYINMEIEKAADLLISHALRLQATDIHITPRQKDYMIRFRLHGHLTSDQTFSQATSERLISHLKFMASMDISEKRKPQSGAWRAMINGQLIALRISTLPTTLSKESLVIRILPQTQLFTFQNMSLFPKDTLHLTRMMDHSHGMIVFSGPAGSGKTTTMYALAELCSQKLNRNVVTLEDPVEKQNDYFLQMQVNEKAGITYSSGLKAILRHDPDIIIVGEIRDAETAKIAVRAAMTGHLVLTSLHTRNAIGAVYRLLEFGIKPLEIEQTLIGVSAQRLVSLLCPFCGAVCSKFCRRNDVPKRVAVYEIIDGSMLQQNIQEINKGKEVTAHHHTLKKTLRKGIALGYISEKEYRRWIFEEKEVNEPKGTRNHIHTYQ